MPKSHATFRIKATLLDESADLTCSAARTPVQVLHSSADQMTKGIGKRTLPNVRISIMKLEDRDSDGSYRRSDKYLSSQSTCVNSEDHAAEPSPVREDGCRISRESPEPKSPTVILRRRSEADSVPTCEPKASQFDYCQWERIFNTVGTGMRIIDLEHRILHVNDAFCRIVGMTFEEAIGQPCHECFPGTACETDNCPLQCIVGGEDRIEFEVEKDTRDGSKRICTLTAAPLRDENGKLIGIIEYFNDITDRERAEQELKAINNELEIERTLLQNKNVALREVLDQIDAHKQQTGQQLQANVNRVILPMLHIINEKLHSDDRHLMKLLESALTDLLDPVASRLEQKHSNLSPREIEVCNMIKNGFSSKQVASILSVSVHTVNNQRRSIRKKLKIGDNQTNLETYLKSL